VGLTQPATCWKFLCAQSDEISFKAGEAIQVLERDDMFQDGWWKGRNASGQAGLFPQSYTSTNSPSSKPLSLKKASSASTPTGDHPVMKSTLAEIDTALKQSKHDSSFLSTHTPNSDEDDASIISRETTPAHHERDWDEHARARSVLAAKARAQIEKAASQEKERSRAKELEQAHYLKTNIYDDDYAPVAGLEFSDESEDEDVTRRDFPSDAPVADLAASIRSNRTSFPADAARIPLPPTEPSTPVSARQLRNSLTQSAAPALDTLGPGRQSPSPSVTSRRSSRTKSEPPVPALPASLAELSAVDSAKKGTSRSSSRSSYLRRKSSNKSLSSSKQTNGNGNGSDVFGGPRTDSPRVLDTEVFPTPSLGELPQPIAQPLDRSLSSQTATATNGVNRRTSYRKTPVNASATPIAAQHMSPSPEPSPSHLGRSQAARDPLRYSANSQVAPQTPASVTSESRPPSQMGSTLGGTQSIRTNDTSPRSSIGKSAAGADPRTWTVEQVVDWGRGKGFDATTLSKFAGGFCWPSFDED
jgi:hypothetical protein